MKTNLSGKVAVVTGGGGILCSSMAKKLAESGAAVAVLDLKEEAAQRVADEIVSANGKAIGVAADVLDRESLRRAEEKVTATLGPCDILVNGAGGNHPRGTTSMEFLRPEDLEKPKDGKSATFFDLDPAGIGFVFNLNFLGTLLSCQCFCRKMAERRQGIVVNVSSMNAFTPLTKIPAYSGAKAAVSNFTRWLAVHFSKVGIRVNAIAPGFFLTEQNRTLLTLPDGTLTERGKTILAHTPQGRFGTPDDLTGALLFLCDESSAFIDGIVLPVDGAFSAFSGV